MRPSLKQAVLWIAQEDEPSETDVEVIATLISIALVSELWGKSPLEIARRVVALRRTFAPTD